MIYLLFLKQSRADEETADGEEEVNPEKSIMMQGGIGYTSHAVQFVVIEDYGKDRNCSPTIQCWKIATLV